MAIDNREILQELRGDRALQLAYIAGAHAMGLLAKCPPLGGYNLGWPSLGALDRAGNAIAARDVLAPFVRANRDAPPEALYIHGRGTAHKSTKAWAVLPLPDTFAYTLFVLVLNHTDAALARQAAELEAATRPASKPRRPGRDEHTFELQDGMFDRTDSRLSDPRLKPKKPVLTLKSK